MSVTTYPQSPSNLGSNFANPLGATFVSNSFAKVPTRIASPGATLSAQEIPAVLDRLAELEVQAAQFHRIVAEAYCTQGRLESALVHQESAVRMLPTSLEYQNQLGYLRYLTGDDSATTVFEDILRVDPRNGEAWYNLAMVRFGQNQFGEAERAFARAAELMPSDAETWNNLGVARFHNGRIAEAKACFERALALDPTNDDARQNLGDCLR